ncbi:MAG: glycosyltransferase family 4 protein [Chloroflexi bacterium]|nr:glycosyltransferase family 4 protein [Chloroflexota bacterium]
MTAGRPARLLHVLSGGTVGGCEQHVLALLARLDRQRYEPWLAVFEAEPDEALPMLPLFRAAGVRTIDLGARRRSDPAAFARFARLVLRGGFDLVHAHSFRTELAAVCAARLASSTGSRRPWVVRTAHNVDEFYVQPRYATLARASARGLDRIVAISDAVADYLRDEARLPAAKIARIHYGLDAVPFDADRRPPLRRGADDRPTLGVIARLAPQKGHRVLFDALPAVLERLPDLHVRIVGHEELSTVAELRAYAGARGVADNVTFEGFRADVADVLADLDLLVLPSLWEGFGLVLLEAMAAGRPVVASAVGPIPEIVVDGETGRLVPPGNPAALASAIVQVLSDSDLAVRFGTAGRQRVERAFSLERMVAQTDALYQGVLVLDDRPWPRPGRRSVLSRLRSLRAGTCRGGNRNGSASSAGATSAVCSSDAAQPDAVLADTFQPGASRSDATRVDAQHADAGQSSAPQSDVPRPDLPWSDAIR